MKDTVEKKQNLTVLYVEDEIAIRNNVEICLRYVFNVVVAQNGKEGLEKFNTHEIDLIVTDINMPIKNGLAMIEEIKRVSPHTPCVVTSAFDHELLGSLQTMGVEKFIAKPFDINELINSIKSILK